mmetsp:Transcript_1785/g.2669  ORF Transcript_1785/g.2669 Transcript_1785/m.2669 type:complete len:407 (+) Transcript_1785:62-1282(+)|eukprot:CAMPEP_0195523584 /NCGR_PEP_ID=MMETSP0794_2-20130614/22834_1 /TAXON_ID=515487 /ORGANISM="Stephanopyxis turris, Strain CCMP 815" /LENGTH=406 /DNA_ID=CAMNT_0040653607 /DNA_START=56 /DNA_END=1276 /DNA_ORIENTATION=+
MGLAPSQSAKAQAHGDVWTFNMLYAHAEALVRGYRKSFLTETEYLNLRNASNLGDVRLSLQETDYGNFLQDQLTLSPKVIREAAQKKMADEFKYIRSQACGELATFLDFISYEYMIDNIILILQHTLNNPNGDVADVLERCHPLGDIGESNMRSIASFEPTKRGLEQLFVTVLISTPVGHYFSQFLQSAKNYGENMAGADDAQATLGETSFVMLENFVYKAYLEDFSTLCDRLGGETKMHMTHVLNRAADKRTINICINSFATDLGQDQQMRETTRQDLIPTVGYLFPESFGAIRTVANLEDLTEVLQPYNDYKTLWEVWGDAEGEGGTGNLDDGFYRMEVEDLENCFYGQSHMAVFYAYVKLKEQEIRNLEWISECIIQDRRDKVEKIIPVFDENRRTRGWATAV